MKSARLARFGKSLLAFALATVCFTNLTACNQSNINGVAATVSGQEIMEPDVTKEVEKVRAQSGLSDNDQWGKFLVNQDMSAEKVRESVINGMVDKILIKNGAADLGVEIPDSDVDESINKFKENFSSDQAWQDALKQAGFTEESYRNNIRGSMVEKKVGEHFDEQAKPTDEDYVTAAKTYATNYDGAKRTSHILFKVEDGADGAALEKAKADAEAAIEKLNSGADFAAMAKELSGDEGSAEKGGDVGWDKTNTFVQEYTDGIKDLEVGQISSAIKSQYGYHVIKVTDKFKAPTADEITSLDQIPEEFRENIKEMALSVKADALYKDWLQGLKDAAEIVINPMPKGLPYDINLKKYEEEKAEKDAKASADAADPAGTSPAPSDPNADPTAATADLTDQVLADEGVEDPAVAAASPEVDKKAE